MSYPPILLTLHWAALLLPLATLQERAEEYLMLCGAQSGRKLRQAWTAELGERWEERPIVERTTRWPEEAQGGPGCWTWGDIHQALRDIRDLTQAELDAFRTSIAWVEPEVPEPTNQPPRSATPPTYELPADVCTDGDASLDAYRDAVLAWLGPHPGDQDVATATQAIHAARTTLQAARRVARRAQIRSDVTAYASGATTYLPYLARQAAAEGLLTELVHLPRLWSSATDLLAVVGALPPDVGLQPPDGWTPALTSAHDALQFSRLLADRSTPQAMRTAILEALRRAIPEGHVWVDHEDVVHPDGTLAVCSGAPENSIVATAPNRHGWLAGRRWCPPAAFEALMRLEQRMTQIPATRGLDIHTILRDWGSHPEKGWRRFHRGLRGGDLLITVDSALVPEIEDIHLLHTLDALPRSMAVIDATIQVLPGTMRMHITRQPSMERLVIVQVPAVSMGRSYAPLSPQRGQRAPVTCTTSFAIAAIGMGTPLVLSDGRGVRLRDDGVPMVVPGYGTPHQGPERPL